MKRVNGSTETRGIKTPDAPELLLSVVPMPQAHSCLWVSQKHIIPYNNPLLCLNEFELGPSVTCNHISPTNTEVPA